MTIPGAARGTDEAVFARILHRYDPRAFDAPVRRSRVRLVMRGGGSDRACDILVTPAGVTLVAAPSDERPDALISADRVTWDRIAADVRAGLAAYRAGELLIRHNLNLAVGFLAATAAREPGRLEVLCVRTPRGNVSTLQAGAGDPVVMIHGLGATKSSFLPTIAALSPGYRTVALDLPGFGDAEKPLRAAYDAPFFATAVVGLLDALDLPRAHVVGHSLGGRVALEMGMRHAARVQSLTLVAPSMAWRRARPWAPYLRLVRPELAMLQLAPRAIVDPMVRRLVPGAQEGWGAVAVDEFLRGFLDPRGRVAFYKAARNIYLEQPHGPDGFWEQLRGITAPALFVWGSRDQLVPAAFARHVERAMPDARHLLLECGHVPQLEKPAQLHRAIGQFLRENPLPRQRGDGTVTAAVPAGGKRR
jgi:pimeloyl-ACP methyl ester carboxylesterase